MATLPPPASPFDPVLEIEHGTVDAKACVNAFYVAISEKSYDADDSGPGATRDKVLLATVTEDALRMFPINVRRGVADYLKPRHDNLRTITIKRAKVRRRRTSPERGVVMAAGAAGGAGKRQRADYRGAHCATRAACAMRRHNPAHRHHHHTMSLAARFFHWHRWVGYLVALQVLAWVLGGLLFSWLPFQPWVKGGDVLAKPQQPLPADWTRALAGLSSERGPLLSLQSVATALGPALKLRYAQGEQWLSAAGGELPVPDAQAIGRYARTLYRGEAALHAVQRLHEAPRRLGIVRELGERADAWQVNFADRLGTRLYFDGRSGEFLAVRNEAWVIYDFFWRLHVMDYEGGEDFNNALLRGASIAALGLVLTGLTLMVLALRRSWRRRRQAAR